MDQEFYLQNPDMLEFSDVVKVNFKFDNVSIFADGKNIEDEDIWFKHWRS